MPLSLELALLSCSGAGFSGDGLPFDSQCIGGENICKAKWDWNDFTQKVYEEFQITVVHTVEVIIIYILYVPRQN